MNFDETIFYRICKETRSMECISCGKILSGVNAHNMKRHYKLMHNIDDILMGKRRRRTNKQEISETPKIDHNIVNETVIEINQNDQEIVHCPTTANKLETNYGKTLTDLGNKRFRKHKTLNKTECLVCGRKLSGLFNANIKRHFQLVHNVKLVIKRKQKVQTENNDTINITNENDDENSLESEQSFLTKRQKLNDSVTIIHDLGNIDRNKFLKCCIGLVAVKGVSANIFDDYEFFKTLIAPQEEKFCTNLNSEDILLLLQRSSLTIRDIIASKLTNKLLALTLDVATGILNKVLSISIQYIDDFKICSNTLDIIQLDKAATDIKDEVLNCLETYGIKKDQVYCYLTNVRCKVENAKYQNFDEELDTETVNSTENKIKGADHMKIFTNIAGEFRELISASNFIQLTVTDVMSEIKTNLNQCRVLVKKLQTMLLFPLGVLTLDDGTNWLSTYDMLKSLLENRTFLEEEFVISFENIENQSDWNFIENIINALTPLMRLQRQLENEQYIFGDFYRDWLSCEIELEELLPSSPYAGLLVQSMQKYKKELLKAEQYLSALYLDPRFNFCNSVMLNEEQKRKAENHLIKIYKVIHTTLKGQNPNLEAIQHNLQNSPAAIIPQIKYEEEPSTSKKAYDKLTQRIMNLSANLSEIDEPQRNFKQKLSVLLVNKMMVPLDTNVLNYWKCTNFDDEISAVLEAALAVPVTQLTTNRAKANALYSSHDDTIDRDLLMTKYNFKEIYDKNVEL